MDSRKITPLHSTMLTLLDQMESDFAVAREEGYGLDKDLKCYCELLRPTIRLTPYNPGAAPLTVAFSTTSELALRLGNWFKETLPFGGSGNPEDDLRRLTDSLARGQLREGTYSDPRLANIDAKGRFWNSFDPKVGRTKGFIWGKDWARGHNARKPEDGGIQWQPWPRRSLAD